MANDVKGIFKKYGAFIVLLFTVVTIVMMFLTNVKYTASGGLFVLNMSGLDGMFGWVYTDEILTLGAPITYSNFSFLILLAYLLPIVGVVLALVFAKKDSLLINIIIIALFVVSVVLFFLMPSLVAYAEGMSTMKDYASLGVGAIIGAIMGILSAAVMALKTFLK